MATKRFTLRNVPLRGGLVTAGQQSMVDEGQLWEAQNISTGLDGGLMKRPGIEQWGQQLMSPRGDVRLRPLFSNVDAWTPSAVNDDIIVVSQGGRWRTTLLSGTGPSVTYSLDGPDSAGSDFGLRVVMRVSNMPASIHVGLFARATTVNSMIGVRVQDDGFYYYNGLWTLLYAHDVAGDGDMVVGVQYVGGQLRLHLDDVLVATADDAVATAAASATALIEVEFVTAAGIGHVTVYLSDMLLGTGDTPWLPDRVAAGTDFDTTIAGNRLRRRFIAATSEYLYVDDGLRGTWVPMLSLIGESIFFARFSEKLIVFDSGTVYAWDGSGDFEIQDDAPQVRFGGEYRSRLFAAGDRRFPQRLYYTAVNQPNVWFSPDDDADGIETEDEVLNAGFITTPGNNPITAVPGDYYGACLFATRTQVMRITGSSPLSFSRETVTEDSGASGPKCVARVGNDMWMIGPNGLTTLQTVMQHGDIQAQSPSGAIADMWTGAPNSSVRVNIDRLDEASLAWSPTQSLLYVCFRRTGGDDVDTIYVCHIGTGSWLGPWTSGSTFVEAVTAATPATKTVMHGTVDGRVGLSSMYGKSDYGVAYKALIQSPRLSGRSLDPQLHNMTKTWKVLRLHVLPRGNWDLLVRWKIDNETFQQSIDVQNVYNRPVLSKDMRLDTWAARLQSAQLAACIDIPIDVRGQYFNFTVETVDDVAADEDFLLQGYEIELTASTYEEAE